MNLLLDSIATNSTERSRLFIAPSASQWSQARNSKCIPALAPAAFPSEPDTRPGSTEKATKLHLPFTSHVEPYHPKNHQLSQHHHQSSRYQFLPPVPIIRNLYTMAPKRNAREPNPSSAATTQASSTSQSVPQIPTKASQKASSQKSPQEVALGIWQNYLDTTPQRTKLIDAFMAFLIVVGVLQFVYCVLVGNFVSCSG